MSRAAQTNSILVISELGWVYGFFFQKERPKNVNLGKNVQDFHGPKP